MTNFANVERRHLAALLRRVGPDAPTLCEGWDTRDLAVHLAIRDARPDAVPGMFAPKLPLLGSHTRSVDGDYRAIPWESLVDLVERPPLHSPGRWSPVDKRMNTGEFFVHHEDVRRAQPQWHPRQLLHDEQKALWAMLKLGGPAMLRKESESVVLLAAGFGA
ncbi:TIGR03085 family metal-binding protein, partial [Streptococcus pneumoniae]